MKIFTVFLFLLALTINAEAQQRHTVTARGETTLEGSLPREMMYAFEHFKDAVLKMNDGSEKAVKVNINLYTGDVLFLTSGNQILILAYPDDVRHMIIDEKIWLQVDGTFWEIKSTQGNVSLIGALKTKITDTRKEGAYGFSSGTSAVGRVSQVVMDGGQIATTLPVGEYDFETSVLYMLISDAKPAIADAKGFKKFFEAKKKEVDAYIKANDIDFKNEIDLVALLEACSKL
ncbi:MAG: hypothetical protein IH591_02610 [Bacteroidales bacterium]|nr:hypothetical protein [Bacteroidales bacterium]